MDLPKIGGEFSLLIAPARHVLVRRHYLPPRFEIPGPLALDGRAGAFSFLSAHLLIKAQAQELHFHLLDLVRLRCRDGSKESPGGIECAVCVVTGEGLLVRPLITADSSG
jgi:hypothetical protein